MTADLSDAVIEAGVGAWAACRTDKPDWGAVQIVFAAMLPVYLAEQRERVREAISDAEDASLTYGHISMLADAAIAALGGTDDR